MDTQHMAGQQPIHYTGMGQPPAPGSVWMTPDQERQEAERQHYLEVEEYWRWVRGAVAWRAELVSIRHAQHAWQERHGLRLAPVSVATLWLDPDGGQHQVKVAGKLFPATDDGPTPLDALFDLTELAAQVVAAGGDPRQEMSESPDPMSGAAVYRGVALSLLDLPTSPWADVIKRRTPQTGYSIAGQVLVILGDDTMLQLDRKPNREPRHLHVAASNPLNPSWGDASRHWAHNPHLTALDDPATRDLWLRLYGLHQALNGGGRHAI